MRTPDLRELARGLSGAGEASRRLASALPAEASRRGLVDVAYGFADSPFGPLMVATTRKGVVTIAYPGDDLDAELERLSAEVSPRVLEWAPGIDPVRWQLDEYFDGKRRRFQVPVDLSLVRGFSRRVLEATARIPFGSVTSYRDVAARAGSPRASRAAGNALAHNPVPIVVPCHRVVHSGGGLGGYTGGLDRKVTLLRIEGVLPPDLPPGPGIPTARGRSRRGGH